VACLFVTAELGPNLGRETARSYAKPVPLQVLTTLGFLATGSFQREGIIHMSTTYIRFPYYAVDQPNIKMIDCVINCTHISIKAPSEEEFAQVNRKHFHSINVQIICDA